jgi:hypothetical protein
LYPSPNIVRAWNEKGLRWGGRLPRRRERRHAFGVLLEKREGNRCIERHRLRWEANVEMDLADID